MGLSGNGRHVLISTKQEFVDDDTNVTTDVFVATQEELGEPPVEPPPVDPFDEGEGPSEPPKLKKLRLAEVAAERRVVAVSHHNFLHFFLGVTFFGDDLTPERDNRRGGGARGRRPRHPLGGDEPGGRAHLVRRAVRRRMGDDDAGRRRQPSRVVGSRGPSVAYLEVREKPDEPKRWHITTRWVSARQAMWLTCLVINEMASLWSVAKCRYTGVEISGVEVITDEALNAALTGEFALDQSITRFSQPLQYNVPE